MCLVSSIEGIFVHNQMFNVEITYNTFSGLSSNNIFIMVNQLYTLIWLLYTMSAASLPCLLLLHSPDTTAPVIGGGGVTCTRMDNF